jgi:hypothetical protein
LPRFILTLASPDFALSSGVTFQRNAWESLLPCSRDEITEIARNGVDTSSGSARTVTIGDAVVLDSHFKLQSAASIVEELEGAAAVASVPRVATLVTCNLIKHCLFSVKRDWEKAGSSRASQSSKETVFRWSLRDYARRPKFLRLSSGELTFFCCSYLAGKAQYMYLL